MNIYAFLYLFTILLVSMYLLFSVFTAFEYEIIFLINSLLIDFLNKYFQIYI